MALNDCPRQRSDMWKHETPGTRMRSASRFCCATSWLMFSQELLWWCLPGGTTEVLGVFFHQIAAILLEKENKNNSWVLIPALKSDNFLEMFASLALSKASEGITAFSATRFLSEMQAAGESRSPMSIFSPSPAQITSHIRPIPKSKVLPFQDWARTLSYGNRKVKVDHSPL